MRSLQECQAEVFRRGRRKIRQRRKRTTGILLACVPLAICLMLLPQGSKEEKAKDSTQQELTGSGLSVTCVEIYGDKVSYSLTNRSDIGYLMGLMESYSVQNSLADGAAGSIEPEAAPEKFESQAETLDIGGLEEDLNLGVFDRDMYHETDKGYTLTLVMNDGTETAYFLLENMLTDLQTGQVTVLPRQQAEKLRAFLEGKVVTQ